MVGMKIAKRTHATTAATARNARPRQTERRSEAAYRAGSWEAESRRPRARRASNDRTTDRPADTPRRIGHRAIFIKSFLLQAAPTSLSLFHSFSLSLCLPTNRLLQPYNVRPDRARISRVRDRIVLLPYLRKSALLRRAVLAYEPTRQPLPFASTTARASSTLRRRPSPPSFLLGRPIVRETRIDRSAVRVFQRRSQFSRVDRTPSSARRVHRKYGSACPRAESDGARAYFAPLTDPSIGKPDVACQVGTPASAMLIATPEVRIQADPRPKPLVPRPLPLSLTPIHIRRRPMLTTRTDPPSLFHRPRLHSLP